MIKIRTILTVALFLVLPLFLAFQFITPRFKSGEVLSQAINLQGKGKFNQNWQPNMENIISNRLPAPVLSTTAGIAYDYTDNKVIYARNIHYKVPIASLTKIMTAVVALEEKKPDEVFTVSQNAASQEPDSMGLFPGEKLSMKELLYGLLLISGNDAAVTIAEGVAGSENNFVVKMNQKAVELGMNDTNFSNASGLDIDNAEQYSSAYDLLVLTHYALEHYPLFAKVVSTHIYQIPERVDNLENHKYFYLENTSPMADYPGFLGVKPGFTPTAKKCLVTLVQRGNKQLLTVVLGSEDRKGETEILLDYSFKTLGLN